MIEQLSVKDYVLFESCIIDFTNGMSVITGETGAGKSLLIDAIGYLSGDRIKSNVIRNGKDKAILSMVLTSNEKVNSILEENGFEVDDQVIISRTILNNNKSTVRINQQITTLSFVRKIVNLLVDVHSQMDTYRLTDTKLQMELLDSYANVEDLKLSVKESFSKYSNILNELETLKNEEFSDSELDFLTAQLDEIENANIQEDELESLNEQIHEASNWFKNKEDLSMCLYEMDKENGALDSLYTLYKQASKSSILNAYEETFKNLYYSLQSVDEELKHIRDTHSNDALDLDSLQNRQYLIKKLYRKYGGSYMSLMESKKNIMDKIDRIIHRQDVFDKLEKEKAESFAAYMKFAKELSLKRKAVFSLLESKVMEHCKDLMLENARFKISCTEKKPSSNGIDEIEFLVSMNPGQDFSSLSVSASGGELSRLMLALKVVFQASNGIETIIFDEIDTGVSGKVALAMGAKMKALSNKYQVLCITHLASVAVMANTHYLVSKKSTFNETITRVQKLDHEQTIQELAIMTSGEASVKAKESMQDLWVKIHG
ncbi:DNA repair protein RecN [Holdemanella biformis]